MEFFFNSSTALGAPLYECYAKNALALIRNIERDKSLSHFDQFNKRFKISWGMSIGFNDNLRITKETTRNCYALMLKLSDLWFAFEHLRDTVKDVLPPDNDTRSKTDFYTDAMLSELGFDPITDHFNQLLWEHVLDSAAWRRGMYPFLAYLSNNTRGKTKDGIAESIKLIKEKQGLAPKHVFSLSYGLRNLYAHEGVAAAFGGKNYKVKECFYMVVYDSLVLYALLLGNAYCERKLSQINL